MASLPNLVLCVDLVFRDDQGAKVNVNVCPECFAVVADIEAHRDWHEYTVEELTT